MIENLSDKKSLHVFLVVLYAPTYRARAASREDSVGKPTSPSFRGSIATDTGLSVLIGPQRFIHHHEEKIILYPMVHSILEYLVWSQNPDPISFIGFCPPSQSFLICKSGYPNFKESGWFLRWDMSQGIRLDGTGKLCAILPVNDALFFVWELFQTIFLSIGSRSFQIESIIDEETSQPHSFSGQSRTGTDLPWICDKAMRKPLRLLGNGQGFRLITKYRQSMSFAVNQTRTADKITVQPNSLVTMSQCKNVQPDSLKLE